MIADFDWAATSAGAIETWSAGLRWSVSLVLRSRIPMVLLWGPDGIMIYNDAYSAFSSGRHPTLLGAPVRQGWPEATDFNDHVMKVGMTGETLSYRDIEMTLYRSGKAEQVWMNLDYSPVLDEAGEPAGILAIVIETTAKVAAERWLTSERDRQRQMFEQAPGFIAMLAGPDHVFELTNAAYMQLVGHRNVLGMPVRQALPEVEGQGYFELLDEVFATGKAFVGSSLRAELQRTPQNDKEELFLDLVYQPVRNPSGDVIGIFVQGQDVTKRVLTERSLRSSEIQFRTLAKAMPNHVWTATPDGMLDWFNTRVIEYSGESQPSLAGHGWMGMVNPDDVPRAAESWAKALSGGAPTRRSSAFAGMMVSIAGISLVPCRCGMPTVILSSGSARIPISTIRSVRLKRCSKVSGGCSSRRALPASLPWSSTSQPAPCRALTVSGISGASPRVTECISRFSSASSFRLIIPFDPIRSREKKGPQRRPSNIAFDARTTASSGGSIAVLTSCAIARASQSKCLASCRISPTERPPKTANNSSCMSSSTVSRTSSLW